MQAPAQTAILRPMQPQPATFDTHAFVKRLTKVGMPEDQAEVLANGQADLYERLVTKEHLEQKLGALELTLRNELEKLRAELKNDNEKLRAELKNDIGKLRAELKNDIDKVQAELKNDIDKVQANLETVRAELKNDIERVQANLEIVKAELKHELEEHKAANRQALKELELTLTHNMKEMEQKLIIKLGVLLGISVTILAALIKFL